MNIKNMRLHEVRERLDELEKFDTEKASLEEIKANTSELRQLIDREKEILKDAGARKAEAERVANLPDSAVNIIARFDPHGSTKGANYMDNTNVEMRAIQKYLINGMRDMTGDEQRALAISGSAAVLPVDVQNKLITSEKYSDLLHRATVFNHPGAGSVYIPVASNTAASWKVENSDEIETTPIEASPTLTKLELKGYELMRLMQMSGAVSSLAVGDFERMMLELLASEVIETLESAFISGTGSDQPKGLDSLSWTPDTNQIKTSGSAVAIGAAHIAEALSLLPQKYARNAIILMNSDMLYNVSQFLGTAEYAYNLADGASSFLGKPIVVSEHMDDDTVYIVDPKELYVRFAMPLQVEADRSAGFTSASIYLRALTVVDAVWNPDACVAVGLGGE